MDKQIKGFFYFLGNEAKVGDKLFAIEFQSSLEDIKAFLVGSWAPVRPG
jgi:hypothetical protein